MAAPLQRTIHRVVVTGVGAVTPIGNTGEAFWEGLRSGRNGVGRVTSFDPTDCLVQIAGEVKDFDVEQYLERKVARRTGRFAQFAAAAGMQAMVDGALEVTDANRDDIGVVMATSGDCFAMGPEWEIYLNRGSRWPAAPRR
jgi:3-oxoacyl-[acyl-carrier-protein] synthase II